jgi:hypothetical protein
LRWWLFCCLITPKRATPFALLKMPNVSLASPPAAARVSGPVYFAKKLLQHYKCCTIFNLNFTKHPPKGSLAGVEVLMQALLSFKKAGQVLHIIRKGITQLGN